MQIVRCDYKVAGDLVLPPDLESHEFRFSNNFSITLKNGNLNDEGLAIDLIASVIGPVTSVDEAESELREVIAESLDLLSFATHSRFKILEPTRLMDWEEDKRVREFRSFLKVDASYPPDPEFMRDFINTIVLFNSSNIQNFTKRALKYFRYGLLDESPEDQHMRFWLALEIIAENIKENTPIPIFCPVCKAATDCDNCGTSPTRMPMAKQAIELFFENILKENGSEAAKRQFDTRNSLMHGGSVASIEKKTKKSMTELVDELGAITWHAIMSTIIIPGDEPYNLGHRDWEFTNKNLIVSARGTFEHDGDTPQPREDRLPDLKISMQTSFNKDREE